MARVEEDVARQILARARGELDEMERSGDI
jgi:BMFP domain-containing protein YqiC